MKKIIVIALALMLCLSASAEILDLSQYTDEQLLEIQGDIEQELADRNASDPASDSENPVDSDAYQYLLNEDGSATLCGYSWEGFENDDDLIIPNALDGHTVTVIGSHCFEGENSQSIGTLMIPDGVKRIEAEAFRMLSANHIHIPTGVEKIEQGAFIVRFNSISVEDGSADYTVVSDALYEKSSKTLLAASHAGTSIPEGIKTIGDYAYYAVDSEDPALSVIPASAERIGAYAFYGAKLFFGGEKIINIPADNLGDYAFSDCTFWCNANAYDDWEFCFSPALTAIPDGCFCGASVKKNTSVKYWSDYSFKYVYTEALYNDYCRMTLPEALLTIGSDAFSGFCGHKSSGFSNENFGSLTFTAGFPAGLKSIGDHCFDTYGKIYVGSEGVFKGNTALEHIGDYAFCNAKLSSADTDGLVIEIPESLHSIGDHTFAISADTGEYNVHIPASVEEIAAEAFCKENVTVKTESGCYAEKWAKENACRYETSGGEDDLSWLND